jgi:hypothetical protein
MKTSVLALLLCVAMAPGLAAAQTAPPVQNPPPAQTTPMTHDQMHAHMAQFRQFAEQARNAQRAARAKMLAALSYAHRVYVAHVIGMLAISPAPKMRTAIAQIDAALTVTERQAILAAATAERAQLRALHEQIRTQMHKAHPEMTQGMQQMQQGMQQMHGSMHHTRHAPDAGAMLLHSLLPGGSRGMMMMHPMHRMGQPPQ